MTKAKMYNISAMLIFGSIGIFVRGIPLSSGQLAFFRGVVGSIFLFLASFLMKEKIAWKHMKENGRLLLLSGAAIGFNWIFLFEAYKYTSVPKATLSYYFAPVFVTFLSPFILKEKLTFRKAGCIAAAMAGMFLVVGTGSEGGGTDNLIGIGYGLLAAALYASVILMNKFLKKLSGLEATFVQLVIAAAVLLPYILLTEQLEFHLLDSRSFLLLLILGIFHTGFAYLLYFTSMQSLSGQVIAVFSYIDPVSALLFSAVFLQETLGPLQLLGGVLVLGSTFISERKNVPAT